MNIIGYLILAFVVLLMIGRKQRQSPSHPANAYAPTVTGTVAGTPTAGDAFNIGTTLAAGVPESQPHCNIVRVLPPETHWPVAPIAPPPIAIQRPPIVAKPPVARPPVQRMPIRPRISPLSCFCGCGGNVGRSVNGFGGGGGNPCGLGGDSGEYTL